MLIFYGRPKVGTKKLTFTIVRISQKFQPQKQPWVLNFVEFGQFHDLKNKNPEAVK